MKWYIGQEIVCVKSHSQGIIKKGEIYVIKGLQSPKCKCNYISIDVGVLGSSHYAECNTCKVSYTKNPFIWWLHEDNFAPIEYNQDAINKLLEETLIEKL